MEELEGNIALVQELVQGREDDVAHARVQLPHDCPAVGEEGPEECPQGGARATGRQVGVALLVGEGQVVGNGAHERGGRGLHERAVADEPCAELVLVEFLEVPLIAGG